MLCSAGIPATYTQVLALNNLSSWQYHAYIGLYVLVFMLDDLLIFTGAMLAMEVTGLGTRYSRWARLFGGVILMAVGVMMIAKPEWLM
jgi:threonine/homoserine/homoserine lactone efflux protein